MIRNIVLIIGAYFFGSVSFAYLVVKWKKGVDVRQFGSGNAGAANVRRILGRKYGIIVAVLDIIKGIIPVMLGFILRVPGYMIILIGAAVIAGHNWPVYLSFKGGNGMATLMGVLVYAMPGETFIAFIVGFVIGLIARSLRMPSIETGAITGYFLLPALAYYSSQPVSMVILPLILGPLLVPSRITFLNRKN